MASEQVAILLAGALAGGIVNGLTGFGTAITALGIWLYAIPPTAAASLAIICSVVSQLQTLHLIWRAIQWRRVLIFVIPGVLGVPIGTWLLPHIDPRLFKLGLGLVLIAYPAYVLARRRPIASPWGGSIADGVVGFSGGVLGGLTGLSGVLPVVWTDVRGWSDPVVRLGLPCCFGLVDAASGGRGGDRAAGDDRRRMDGRLRLPAARRPRLSARGHGAAAGVRSRPDLDDVVNSASA
jgi:hypothetical protein